MTVINSFITLVYINLCHVYKIREMYNFQESMHEKVSRIDCLLLHEKAEIPEEFVGSGIRIVRVSSVVMKKLCGVQSIESIDAISLVRIPSTFRALDDDRHQDFTKWFPSAFRILVLDGIQVICIPNIIC